MHTQDTWQPLQKRPRSATESVPGVCQRSEFQGYRASSDWIGCGSLPVQQVGRTFVEVLQCGQAGCEFGEAGIVSAEGWYGRRHGWLSSSIAPLLRETNCRWLNCCCSLLICFTMNREAGHV